MRVYNLYGRRDNKYKARIKILVHETGAEEIARQVEAECGRARRTAELTLPRGRDRAHRRLFRAAGAGRAARGRRGRPDGARSIPAASRDWLDQNVATHRHPGYAVVTISLKAIGEAPGDATPTARWKRSPTSPSDMRFDEIRVSHEQNLILPHVRARRPQGGL